jgi:hypothetical protein
MVGLVNTAAELVIEGPAGAHGVAVSMEIAFLLAAKEHCAACEAEYEESL